MVNGFALGQLSRAFLTAVTHEDAEVRARADRLDQLDECFDIADTGDIF